MFGSWRLWLLAAALAAYLYFLLPATATLFYELYHLTGVEPVYWGYIGFKWAGYYFGVWPWQAAACVATGLGVVVLTLLFRRARGG